MPHVWTVSSWAFADLFQYTMRLAVQLFERFFQLMVEQVLEVSPSLVTALVEEFIDHLRLLAHEASRSATLRCVSSQCNFLLLDKEVLIKLELLLNCRTILSRLLFGRYCFVTSLFAILLLRRLNRHKCWHMTLSFTSRLLEVYSMDGSVLFRLVQI